MIPAHQRLETVDGTALEHHDRLVMEDELFLVEPRLQIMLELHPVLRRTREGCFVFNVASLAF